MNKSPERTAVEIVGERCFGNPLSNAHCRLETLPQEIADGIKKAVEAKKEEIAKFVEDHGHPNLAATIRTL